MKLKTNFCDRFFNLSPRISTTILQFFLDQQRTDLFLHFEMVPDRFPTALRQYITQFPEGSIECTTRSQLLPTSREPERVNIAFCEILSLF